MDIKERNYTAQLNKLLVVNLKNDLPGDPENWKYCQGPEKENTLLRNKRRRQRPHQV